MLTNQQPSIENLGIAREGSRLRKVMIGVAVLDAVALVAGIATGNYQLFVFILVLAATVVGSWMWSVGVDRAYHRWRHWSREQRPKPVPQARVKTAARQWPLRGVTSGPCSLTLANLIDSDALPLVWASAEGKLAAERILAGKIKAFEQLRQLADELETAGDAQAAVVAEQAARMDFRSAAEPGGDWDDLSRALALLDARKFEEAESALRPLESGGGTGAVRYALAVASGAQGRPAEAADWFQMAAEAGAESGALRMGLGVALWEKGERDRAVKQLRAAVTMEPMLPMAHAALGAALVASGDLDEGRDALDNALELDPELPLARSALGAALYEKGDFGGASYEMGRASAADPGNTDLVYNHAAALSAAGRHEEVIERGSEVARVTGDAHLSRIVADAHEKKGSPDAAREFLAASASADSTDAQIQLARSLRQSGQYEEAMKAAESAAKAAPKSAAALVEMGAIREAQGRDEDALQLYRTAAAMDRMSAAAAVGAGRVLLERGNAKEALAHLRVIASVPDAPGDGLYYLGRAHLAMNKPLLAIEALRQASASGSLSAEDLSAHLGRAYLAAGRHKEAAEELRRARKLAPEHPEVHRDLGYALHRLRSYDEARRSLQAYLDARPDAADAAEVKQLADSL